MSTRSTDARVAEALEEYLAAVEAGKAPDRAAFLASHPDLEDALSMVLRGLDFVHHAAKTLDVPEAGGEIEALGDYRLIREIGRGGMAVVYEAEQVSLGRRVALKVLPFAAVLDGKQLQRFKNEALAAAHLQHPHIVPVHGVGSERGVHYYAMQYIEGQSLAAAIRDLKGRGGDDGGPEGAGEGPRSPLSSHGSNREPKYIRMASALGMQAAEALDHAHQLGVVHRDVKPGNLLVDQSLKLWVTDFGLARSRNDVGLTVTGELLGTVRYMSPEQALAKRVPIDHRTDVYSLGATLYELLTLEPAFPGDDPHRVIQDIALREPTPPRRLNPALPRDLETVLLKAMAKDPASRYATALEMADDLRRCLEDKPVQARRPSVLARAAKWSRRHRGLVAAALTVLFVGALALAAGARHEERNTRAALGRADAARKRAEWSLSLARYAVARFLAEAGIADLEDRPLPPPGRRALLEDALRFYEAHPEDPDSAWRCATIFHELHRYEEAVATYDRLLAMRPGDAATVTERGHLLWHVRRYDDALAALDQAIRIDPGLAEAHNYRGLALFSLSRFEDALSAYDRAIAIDAAVARYHHNRGNALHHRLGRSGEALAAFDRAIEISPNKPGAHSGRGDVLHALGRFAEALAAQDRAITLDPDLVLAHNGRGNALSSLGRPAEALEAHDRAIALDARYEWAHTGRGIALCALGRYEEAAAAHREALRIRPDHPEAHLNLGNVFLAVGEFDGAIREYREAVRLKPDYAGAHNNLGNALAGKGAANEAMDAYREAIRIRPDQAEAHCNLAALLATAGRLDEAIDVFRGAIRIRPDYADAHRGLGLTLLRQGRFREALSSLRTADDMGSTRPGWVALRSEVLESVERQAKAEERLDRVLSGEARPGDAAERIALAEILCCRSRHAEAAGMYAEAFAETPSLAEDLVRHSRYNAACCAALAAAPGGADAAAWRARALEWLGADLAAREKAGLLSTLEPWKRDPDLAGVRDRLQQLADAEREAWTKLWADVDRLLAAAR